MATICELSGWQQLTGVPKSARQAETTVPIYPAPYTPICMEPPECHYEIAGEGCLDWLAQRVQPLVYACSVHLAMHGRDLYLSTWPSSGKREFGQSEGPCGVLSRLDF